MDRLGKAGLGAGPETGWTLGPTDKTKRIALKPTGFEFDRSAVWLSARGCGRKASYNWFGGTGFEKRRS
jgi:hypothetical protein